MRGINQEHGAIVGPGRGMNPWQKRASGVKGGTQRNARDGHQLHVCGQLHRLPQRPGRVCSRMVNVFRRLKSGHLERWWLTALHEVAQRPELLDVLSNAPMHVEQAGDLPFLIADLASLGGFCSTPPTSADSGN
jgi:hypothetical protein